MISFSDKESRSEIQGTSPVAAKPTSSLTHDDQQPSSSTGKRLRNHFVVIRAVSNWHGLLWGKWASPRSSGHCRLHWQEHRGEVSGSRRGVRLMGGSCGYVAGPRLPRWTMAESVLNLAREMSFSLGSCGCLDVALCDILFEFNFQDDSPLTCFKDVLKDAILCGLKTVPKIICNQANVHISGCFSATQDTSWLSRFPEKSLMNLICPHYWFTLIF